MILSLSDLEDKGKADHTISYPLVLFFVVQPRQFCQCG